MDKEVEVCRKKLVILSFMAINKGNKNAEKWTLEKSEALLDEAIELTDRVCDYVVHGTKVIGYEFDFIGEIARHLKVYHELITRDIRDRHSSLKPKIKLLKNNLESNCYSNTKKGIINTAVGIVNLKSNHKWTDRVDNTTKDKEIKPTTINFTSNED